MSVKEISSHQSASLPDEACIANGKFTYLPTEDTERQKELFQRYVFQSSETKIAVDRFVDFAWNKAHTVGEGWYETFRLIAEKLAYRCSYEGQKIHSVISQWKRYTQNPDALH